MLLQHRVKSFLILILIGMGSSVISQTLEDELGSVFLQEELLGLSVEVNVAGKTENFSFGKRDVARDLPITASTQFRIASISKALTALGIMKLYDDGLVDLDEDISTYLGYQVRNPNFPSVPITLRKLLSHQSSLQDGTGYNNFLNATFSQSPIPNINELIVPGGDYYTTNLWRTESPGSYFAYSNLNFGVLGTIIEAVSNERFDVYMKSEILEPLGIIGSFNIQDLPNIDNLAVLYRFQNGSWQPQQDNYGGIMPPPPDLSGYSPGTNGLYFGPQGSLRCSASEINLFLEFLQADGANSNLSISTETLQEMKAIAWNYNGSNGDNYFGLFNRWGLGLHHANVNPGDAICITQNFGSFIGHPGEAYGLISDAFFADGQEIQFSMLINGSRNGYQIGSSTSFYTVEEAIFNVLCNHFENVLSVAEPSGDSFEVYPNPSTNFVTISSSFSKKFSVALFSIEGKKLFEKDGFQNHSQINVSNLANGVYFLKISTGRLTSVKKISVE